MDDFDKWDFDIFKYNETLGEATLTHFGFKLFQIYGLLDKLLTITFLIFWPKLKIPSMKIIHTIMF